MLRLNINLPVQVASGNQLLIISVFLLVNLFFNVMSNTCFKVAAETSSRSNFLFWEVVGNIAGFITVITLTGLLRYMPLSVAFPVTTGLAIIGVQVIGAHLLFHEALSFGRLLGAVIIMAGIVLVSSK